MNLSGNTSGRKKKLVKVMDIFYCDNQILSYCQITKAARINSREFSCIPTHRHWISSFLCSFLHVLDCNGTFFLQLISSVSRLSFHPSCPSSWLIAQRFYFFGQTEANCSQDVFKINTTKQIWVFFFSQVEIRCRCCLVELAPISLEALSVVSWKKLSHPLSQEIS